MCDSVIKSIAGSRLEFRLHRAKVLEWRHLVWTWRVGVNIYALPLQWRVGFFFSPPFPSTPPVHPIPLPYLSSPTAFGRIVFRGHHLPTLFTTLSIQVAPFRSGAATCISRIHCYCCSICDSSLPYIPHWLDQNAEERALCQLKRTFAHPILGGHTGYIYPCGGLISQAEST